ncbi:ubiA prenyltransferase domain-containing protein 1 homolog [Ischnura elegans]|uniref:ubiA prenyltransferase domain-containing protein 1 homolog n=1 Tax=Ischnura elegans TaxID=197161 RepID=UPI001ED8A822|nr:ubiA prenyltransferase domain-containing protein 1 homolog [Ischnura elegans]
MGNEDEETQKQKDNHADDKTHMNLTSKRRKLASYVLALRPWTLSASLMPTLLGAALAHKCTGDFSLLILLITAFTVLSVHGAGNAVNTYFDYVKGVDIKTKADDRTLVDALLSVEEVANLGGLLYLAGCLGFVTLAALSPARMEHLALVYFGGLSSSFLYTGGIGLKYIALGDVLVLVLFGPLSVLFAFLAQAGTARWATIFYALPLALNAEAILHGNNTRDLEADRRAGIVTLAILAGHTVSHVLYAFLLFTPYIMFVVLSLHHSIWFLLPLVTLPAAFQLEKELRSSGGMQAVPRKTAQLNLFFGLLYVLTCTLINSEKLPYINQ